MAVFFVFTYAPRVTLLRVTKNNVLRKVKRYKLL